MGEICRRSVLRGAELAFGTPARVVRRSCRYLEACPCQPLPRCNAEAAVPRAIRRRERQPRSVTLICHRETADKTYMSAQRLKSAPCSLQAAAHVRCTRLPPVRNTLMFLFQPKCQTSQLLLSGMGHELIHLSLQIWDRSWGY